MARAGVFTPVGVARLLKKCKRMADEHLSFKDNMAFVGILSTQLLINQYIDDFCLPVPLKRDEFSVWQDHTNSSLK